MTIFCILALSFSPSVAAPASPLLLHRHLHDLRRAEERRAAHDGEQAHLHPEDGLVRVVLPALAVLGDPEVAGVQDEDARDAVHAVGDDERLRLLLRELRLDEELLRRQRRGDEDEAEVVAVRGERGGDGGDGRVRGLGHGHRGQDGERVSARALLFSPIASASSLGCALTTPRRTRRRGGRPRGGDRARATPGEGRRARGEGRAWG